MLRAIALTSILFAASTGAASAADLRVKVTGIQATTGTISLMVVDSDAAWNGKGQPVTGRHAKVSGDTLEIDFADLKPGKYAIRLMHDENDNGKLDTNMIGMPTEGYGFSNNPRVMRAAHFDEAVFEVPADGATITIVMR